MTQIDCDVAIVGYGPVGQMLAGLLAQDGHSVTVVERHRDLYRMPRAIRFDGEAMRMFQRLGVVDDIRDHIHVASGRYEVRGADGEPIMGFLEGDKHPSGWSNSYTFFQPDVEQAVDAAVRERLGVEVRRGWTCEGLQTHDDHVELHLRAGVATAPDAFETTEESAVLRARYVVGADGANSTIRAASGIRLVDYGFSERWAVADVRPHDDRQFEHVPIVVQYCDPRRPHAAIRGGVGHRRWEFMLLPDEDPADYDDPARLWELLAPFIEPDQGTLVRKAVYEFRSLQAETMREGRALLVGDAAHLMPPHRAEGMCSGMRDANNLAWRLDHVLRGVADDALLDSYTTERAPQNEAIIRMSIELGRISCTLDPEAAAARDAALRSGAVPPPAPVPGIGPGVVHDGSALAGNLAVQGRIELERRSGLLDDVLDARWVVVCTEGEPHNLLGDERMAFIERELRGATVSLDPSHPDSARDLDGALTAWLDEAGVAAVVARPDGYVYGTVSDLTELAALVDDLRAQLKTPHDLSDRAVIATDSPR